MSAPEVQILGMPPGAWLERDQARRATALGLALALTAGRSVPIQVVERIAHWIDTGAVAHD